MNATTARRQQPFDLPVDEAALGADQQQCRRVDPPRAGIGHAGVGQQALAFLQQPLQPVFHEGAKAPRKGDVRQQGVPGLLEPQFQVMADPGLAQLG